MPSVFLKTVGALLGVLGLPGLFLRQAHRAGMLGVISFALTLQGLAALVVAAYGIVQESLTSVVRQASARFCTVRHGVEARSLCLENDDDARGPPPVRQSGVGPASMQERGEELGGRCVVTCLPGGGTRVKASLPLPKEES